MPKDNFVWIKIFRSEEEARMRVATGRPQLLIINDVRLSLVLYNHEFFAVQDSCSHNKESLSKGSVNFKGEIVCPWHGYCFDLRTGREGQERSSDLVTYAIRIDENGFYIQVPT
jgi:nitrite reductase/ring-hydroxylating ferredoxin subunit